MRVAVLFPVVLFSAACSPVPTAEGSGGSDITTTTKPLGFDAWLSQQCPDGRTLRATAGDGKQTDVVCEEVRDQILADSETREQAVTAYLAEKEDKQCNPSSESTCEAREPWSIFGLICDIIAASVIAHQREVTHQHWGNCAAASVVPAIVCQML